MVLSAGLFVSLAEAQNAPADAPATASPSSAGADASPAPPVDPIVQKGEYLARLGNCISCHTAHGGEPFAGGLTFKTPYMFLGTLYSTNITPDEETGIGTWSEEDFVRAMHTGEGPGGGLFPAFPYTSFTKVTDEDVKAIYAYLRTVKPVKYEPPGNSFVFSFAFRFGLKIWNAMFFQDGRYVADSSQSEEWNRGAYLVNGLGHCSACHTPRNVFLAEKGDEHLWGAVVPDVVLEAEYRPWFAVNLTQTKNGGLAAWSVDDLRRYLKTGHNRFGGAFGPMNEVIANSLQYLTDEDARAMATYIKSLLAAPDTPAQQMTDEERTTAEALYKKHCEECHAASGRGGFMKAPHVAGSSVAQGRDPASLINIILYGAEPPKGLNPPGAWESMRSFRDRMTDEEIAAVANYVRSSWNNTGGKVTAQDVAKQR